MEEGVEHHPTEDPSILVLGKPSILILPFSTFSL